MSGTVLNVPRAGMAFAFALGRYMPTFGPPIGLSADQVSGGKTFCTCESHITTFILPECMQVGSPPVFCLQCGDPLRYAVASGC